MNTATTIETRVKHILAENLGGSVSVMKLTDSLVDDLGADSLDQVELVMSLEDEFEIDIPDHHGMALTTVQQVVDYITERLAALA